MHVASTDDIVAEIATVMELNVNEANHLLDDLLADDEEPVLEARRPSRPDARSGLMRSAFRRAGSRNRLDPRRG